MDWPSHEFEALGIKDLQNLKRTIKKKLPNDDNDFEQNGKELTFNFEMFKEHEDAEFENSLSLESSDSLYNLYY